MTLRYTKVTFYPRVQKPTARGALAWTADRDHPQEIKVGITGDRANRAEVRGDVEIEVYNIRFPYRLEGVGPGAVVEWDGSDWDVAAPAFLRTSRARSVRHQTSQIRRRPYRRGGRD